MTATTPTTPSAEALASSLRRVVADHDRTAQLYPIFGRFCHDFRNHLNSLNMSFYLARRLSGPERIAPAIWDDLHATYKVVERLIDRFQQVCKAVGPSTVKLPLSALFEDRSPTWSDRLARSGRRLLLSSPPSPETAGQFDPMKLTVGLDDLVSWRVAVGLPDSDLRVQWSADAAGFRIDWDEPTLPRAETRSPPIPLAAASEPLPTPLETWTLTALTVPLLTRIMMSHGGTLETTGPESDRWHLTMRWPLDARPTTPRESTSCSPSPPTR